SVFPPPVAANVVDRAVKRPGKPLSILWCHRWEYDKNPEAFFDVLLKLDEAGCAFELVILGEQFRTAPPVFGESWDRLKPHIRHTGFIRDRAEYLATLAECELVVSTAIQENFGIAVVEAVLAGCEPLLPNRLAYPEVIPPEFHDKCLYAVDGDLFICLKRRLDGDAGLSTGEMTALMASLEARFGASSSVKAIDDELERIACDADCGL
ncbi:MAG: glycosyltransferase, partial [Phycisphaerales bacterium]